MISWERNETLDQDDAVIRVLDFGISQCQGSGDFMKGGTVDYMAPEQYPFYDGRPELQPSTDLYALALTLYELLIGHLPWGNESTEAEIYRQKIEGNIPNVCDLDPTIPTHVGEVLMKALNPDINKRYPSAKAMSDALMQETHNENDVVEDPILIESEASSNQKLWQYLVLLLLVAIGVLLFEQIP